MNSSDFKSQVFRTPAQWQNGLSSGLQILPEGGLTLYPRPAFESWLPIPIAGGKPTALAVDECGLIYWIAGQDRCLYRYDSVSHKRDRLYCSHGRGASATGRLLMDRFDFWMLDAANRRVLVFSRETFQLKLVIAAIKQPVDIARGRSGILYVLDQDSRAIFRYDAHGRPAGPAFGGAELQQPIGLIVGRNQLIYVLDRNQHHFLRYDAEGNFLGLIGDFDGIAPNFEPVMIAANAQGNLFVVDGRTQQLHEFDAGGSHLGVIQLLAAVKSIKGIAFDRQDDLYLSTDQGLARFSARLSFVGETGAFYSRTLDNGADKSQWHRLALEAELPAGTILEIFYHSSDDTRLRGLVEAVFTDPNDSVQRKVERLEALLGTKWTGPEKNPTDMLLREKTSQFLWLKLALSTFDANQKPTVRELRAYYPRISYLRYLPATYQEDAVSRAFLERFLSLFESVLYDMETEITALFKNFDPLTTPAGFLDWLASWLNLALEEEWPEARKRQFLLRAPELFKQKGTAAGIAGLVEIYTGQRPLIVEHALVSPPLILGKPLRLGLNSVVGATPIGGFRLGDSAVLGRTALREVAQLPEDPFQATAHRFTLLLNMSRADFQKQEAKLREVLNDETPAHTAYTLRLIGAGSAAADLYVGVNSRVEEYQPFLLGSAAQVGRAVAAIHGEKAVRLERNSKIGRCFRLI